MRRWALLGALAGALVLLVATVAIGRPYLTRQRDYRASVPQPPSVLAVQQVRMKPGQAACVHDAVMDIHSERVLFQVDTYHGKPTVPLRVTLAGDRYRATVNVPASAYENRSILNLPAPAPDRDIFVTACVRNVGRHSAALEASTSAEPGPVFATLDGKPVPTNPWLAFYEAKPTSIAHRLPTIVSRMGIFRPPFIGGWLPWPLGVLFAFGVPAAILVAYARALDDDEADDVAG
jgi:hypothetical protein